MLTITATILGALLLGALHSFDWDHIAAVSGFVAREKDPKRASYHGVRWGLGHSTSLFLVGLLLIGFRLTLPFETELFEILSGGVLVLLGGFILFSFLRDRHIHLHSHKKEKHSHYHLHPISTGGSALPSGEIRPQLAANGSANGQARSVDCGHSGEGHSHTLFLVGTIHGLAGSARVLFLLPVSFLPTPGLGMMFVLTFALGTVISMGLFGYFAARLFVWNERRQRLSSSFRVVTALFNLAVGIVWIANGLHLSSPFG